MKVSVCLINQRLLKKGNIFPELPVRGIMNQVVLLLLYALLFGMSLAQLGHGVGVSQRCLCIGKPFKIVNPRSIQAVDLFQPSPSCSNRELIVTVIKGRGKGRGKGNGKRSLVCLDPNGKQGKKLLRQMEAKPKNRGKKEKNKFDKRDVM